MLKLYDNVNLYVFLHSSREKSLYYDMDSLSTEYEVLVNEQEELLIKESLPYLIKVDLNDEVLMKLFDNELLMQDAFFIKSTENIATLADRFKVLFKLKNETDEEYYFTFYVASIFKMFLQYLKIHKPPMIHALLENIDMIYLPKYTKDKEARLICYMCNNTEGFLEGISSKNENNSTELIYDKTMRDYFSSYRTHEFMIDIYDELKINYPTSPKATEDRGEVVRWFYEIIKEAIGYGVTEEDSVANLLKASWLLNQSVISLNDKTKLYLSNDELSAYHKSKDLLDQTLKAYERGQNA